jgi:hypothetical protein
MKNEPAKSEIDELMDEGMGNYMSTLLLENQMHK